ncbi:3687_t:CDS:10, partial [Funneliformis caledonium]
MDKTAPVPNSNSNNSVNNSSGIGGPTTILPAAPFPQPAPRSPSSSSAQTDYSSTTNNTATAGSYEFLYELVQKRITTFTYLKQAHEGRIHWFNTVCLSKEDLRMMYENVKMKKRTGNFFILGASLAPILDITNPQDYVKALNVMLQEFEYHTNEHARQKMKMFFRKSKIVKDEDTSFQENGEYTYLFVPNIPFDLDYFQTFYTLCDILVDVYNKLLEGTANTLTASFTESVLKVDGKFKKIIALVAKEIDTLARNTIKEELRPLDPMMIIGSASVVGSKMSSSMSIKSNISNTTTLIGTVSKLPVSNPDPAQLLFKNPPSLASNDTSAAETSTSFGFPVVFPPEECTGNSNNIGFPPATDQMSSSVSEGGLTLPPYSSTINVNGQGYYYNIPANAAVGSDHGTSKDNTVIVVPMCPIVDNTIVDNHTSLPLESKTPAEYALSILFRQFAKVAEKKLSIIMNHSVDHELEFASHLGPGVDQSFDKLLNSLGYIARHKPKPVIDSVLYWRKEKQVSKQDIPDAPSHKRNLSDTILTNRTKEIENILLERKRQVTLYIVSRTLIEIVKQIQPETLRDEVGKQMEDLVFKLILETKPEEIQRSRHTYAVYELFAELIGGLSKIRFVTVSDRFIARLESYVNLPPQALKEQETKVELLIKGMHHLQLKIYPSEALEETAEFLQSLAGFLKSAHGVRIKHAYSELFVRLLMPIAGIAESEVNVPAWVRAVEMMFPKAWKMTLKHIHYRVAYPLSITILCVSQRDYFLTRLNDCLSSCYTRFKDKTLRQMAMGCVIRLLWTYLYRCYEGTTSTYKRLEEIIKVIFPSGRRSIVPSDANLDLHVQFVQFVGMKHYDFCMKNLIFMLMNSDTLASSSKPSIDYIMPDRMRIGIRSFMLLLSNIQSSESKPPFPSNPDLLSPRHCIGVKSTSEVLPDEIFNRAGLKEHFDKFCETAHKIALILDTSFGFTPVLDDKPSANRAAFPPTLANVVNNSESNAGIYNQMNFSLSKDKQPYLNLLREYVDSLPRLLPNRTANNYRLVEMLCKYTVHLDSDLAFSAALALRRIAHQCGAATVVMAFSHIVYRIDDKYADILVGEHPGTGTKYGGVLRLYLDLLRIWLMQLQQNNPNDTSDRSNPTSPKISNGVEDPSIWTIIEEAEANGLFFLCSTSCLIRKYAINILHLVADLEREFDERNEKKNSIRARRNTASSGESKISGISGVDDDGRTICDKNLDEHGLINSASIKLFYSATSKDNDQLYTRVIHVLTRGGGHLITFDTDLQNSLSIIEHVLLQKHQLEGKRDILLRLIESDDANENRLWSRCFPDFMKICFEYFPVTVALCRNNVCARLLQMQNSINGAADAIRAPAAPLSMAKFHYSKMPVIAATDDIIEQWKFYLLVACSTITDNYVDRIRTNGRNRSESSSERTMSARTLFKMVLPLLASESKISNAVVTSLGNINENVYKVLLEDMQPYFRHVSEDYKFRASKQMSNAHKKARRNDKIRSELAHVYQLTSHFLIKVEYIRDATIVNWIMNFVNETYLFLKDSEVSLDWSEWNKLRMYFCGVVEKLYDGISSAKVNSEIMSPEMRTSLYLMIEEWCGHGERGLQYKATNVTQFMDQCRDAEDRRPIAMEGERKSLEFAALNAMASLCRGPLVMSDKNVMKMPQSSLPDADSVFAWIQSVFENPQDKLHPIARKALEGLLISNSHVPQFLEIAVRHCYSGNPALKSTQGYFLAVAETFFIENEYPCERACKMMSLALFKVGDAELEIRQNALRLLKIIETRFFGEICSDDFEVGITSQLSSIYKQAQIHLSARLAEKARKRDEEKCNLMINDQKPKSFKDLYEETHYMLSEITNRFEFIPDKIKKDVLCYLVPWVRNVELLFDNCELQTTTFVMISNLFFITVKYGDLFVKEIEKLWQQLVMGEHDRNVRAIVKYLIDVGLEKRNPIFVLHAKRVFIYLGRTASSSAVIKTLINEITPKSMTPQPKEPKENIDVEELKIGGMYLSKIEDAMPQHHKRPVFSSGQLAMLYMVDMAIETKPDFELHLPRLLHVLFVQLDAVNPLISEETRSLLINLIHSVILSKCVYPDVVKVARALIAELKAKEGSRLWEYEDMTYHNRTINSLADLEKLSKDVVNIFGIVVYGESNKEDLRQMWGEMALKWATSCPVRHIACRSFQIFRSLNPVFNEHMLADVLARLSNTISDNSEDFQGFALEILITLSHVVDWLEPGTKEIFPQLLWATIACLQTINEPEFLEALSILDKILDKFDLSDEENQDLFWSFFPKHKWHGQFYGIQPLLMKGICSATACHRTFEMLKKLLFIRDDQLIDPGHGRLLYLILANLPRLVHSLEDVSIREECKQWATYLSDFAEHQELHNLNRVLTSFVKGKFRSKDDFLKQIILCIKDNYFPDYEVQTLLFLMSLLSNKLPYYKLKTMIILKMLLPHVDIKRAEFVAIGSELILPLLRLLQTQYSQEALEVLDETISIPGGPKDKQILRMSIATRRGNNVEGVATLFGEPDDSGWAIPDRTVAMEATRYNIHAVCYTCKVTPQDQDYQFFAEDIAQGYIEEEIPTREYRYREIVSRLQDLNEYFLPGDDQDFGDFVEPSPNEYESRADAILQRSLSKSPSNSSFKNYVEPFTSNSNSNNSIPPYNTLQREYEAYINGQT